MNESVQEKQSKELEDILIDIRKDVEEASLLAAEVSDKFSVISKEIQGLSKVFTKAFKDQRAGQIVKIAGFAVNLLGKGVSLVKEEYELMKLLPKKQALAANKKTIIFHHLNSLESKLPRFKKLLSEEANRDFSKIFRKEFEEIHGKDCCSAFEMYTFSLYLYDVCFFMTKEFEAWENSKHNSDLPKPLKHNSLSKIIDEVLAPSGLKDLFKDGKKTGSMYLFSKYDGLLGSIFVNVHANAVLPKEKEKLRIWDQANFIALTSILNQVNSFYEDDDQNPNINWISRNVFFKEIKNILKMKSAFIEYSKYIFFGVGLLSLVITQSLVFSLILSLFVTPFIFGMDKMLSYLNRERTFFQVKSLSETIFGFILQIASLGTLWYAKKQYMKKEDNYRQYFLTLGQRITL